MTTERMAVLAVELAAVAIHPYPVGLVSYLEQSRLHTTPPLLLSETELEIILALPMFLRFYLLGRAMKLHSRLFTDTASRSIGALNKVGVDVTVVSVGMEMVHTRVGLGRGPGLVYVDLKLSRAAMRILQTCCSVARGGLVEGGPEHMSQASTQQE